MAELLRVENLSAGYGEALVIQGIDFALEDGRSLALLGRNGVGKTTLIDTIVGVTTRFSGKIWLGGVNTVRGCKSRYRRPSADFAARFSRRRSILRRGCADNVPKGEGLSSNDHAAAAI